MNNGTNFHAIIGGVLGAPVQMLFMPSGAQNSAPASRTRIAFTCAVGINDDMGERFCVGHTVNLLGLDYLPGSDGFQRLGSIGQLLECASPGLAQ